MALDHTDNGDPPAKRSPDADDPTPTDAARLGDDATREMPAGGGLGAAGPSAADPARGDAPGAAAEPDDARVPEFDPTRPRADDDDDADAPALGGAGEAGAADAEREADEAREVDPDPADEVRDPDATEEWAPDETDQPTGNFPARDPELEALRDASFPVVWRGYDAQAVDAYVASVSRAVARFEERTFPTVAVQRALDRVGEQTAAILRQAEQSAEETTRASRAKADDRLQRAEREAADVQAGAIARVRELDDDIERLWQERQRLIDATKDLADQLRSTALDAEARFPPAEAPPAAAAPFDAEPDAARADADAPDREAGTTDEDAPADS